MLDDGFGTVEKVSDAPLTVRYTIDPAATWSDGTAVTPADLLLEWAARSGQLDDVTPELDAQGGVVNNDELDAGVAFAAASPALVQAQQRPTVDGATLTLVYATPVPDWQVALDVNVPAHVVGQTALGVEDAGGGRRGRLDGHRRRRTRRRCARSRRRGGRASTPTRWRSTSTRPSPPGRTPWT